MAISAACVITRCFVFNQLGDVERCALRPGNVHSADGWRAVLEPVIARYRDTVKRLYFRGDAAFANPEIYEFLEAEGMGYAIRLPANRVLQETTGISAARPRSMMLWPPILTTLAQGRMAKSGVSAVARMIDASLKEPPTRRLPSAVSIEFVTALDIQSVVPGWRRWMVNSNR